MHGMSWITQSRDGVVVSVHASPKAARNEVQGLHGDALKVRLHAPPVDGKANDTLIRFVADRLRIPARNVTILSGETNRRKRLLIRGIVVESARQGLLPDSHS